MVRFTPFEEQSGARKKVQTTPVADRCPRQTSYLPVLAAASLALLLVALGRCLPLHSSSIRSISVPCASTVPRCVYENKKKGYSSMIQF